MSAPSTIVRPTNPSPSGASGPPADGERAATPASTTGRRPGPSITLDVAATAGLALYSLVAALGFWRVFADWEFVGDALIIVVVGHGSSLVLRLLRVPGVIAVLVTLLALVWIVGYLHHPSTYSALLPSSATWDVASADLALVRDQFRTAVAPVVYVGGWALLASIGTAFAVFSADVFAFRANARGEALVPGGVLFVFVAALGADRSRIPLAVALVGAGFLAAALLRARAAPTPRTVLGGRHHTLATVLGGAVVAGGLVVLAAWVIGPRLPGAGEEPLVDTRNEGGGVTEVLSPLVDIRSRLVNRSANELFVVLASTPAYWRATALPEFDGQTWGLPDRALEDVDGGLQEARPGSTENRQELLVTGLGGALLPAAAEPVAASGNDLRWNPETSTLVKVGEPLASGDRYDIVSAMPLYTPDELRTATSLAPPDPIYLELPDDLPSSVRDEAAAVVAGAPTAYDQAVALQTWFRTEFEYSTDVPPGHGNSAIEAFLRQRIGYCEQFAGTFAAMARSLGIPARVAVGFTPGLLQPDGSRSVLGRNAHAWPELWFDAVGWVAFEPTPGRGAPGAESYTGVAPAQNESVPTAAELAGDPGDVPETLPATPVTIPIEEEIPAPNDGPPPAFTAAAGRVEGGGISGWGVLLVIAALVVAAALPAIVRRWRRHHPDPDPVRRIRNLWSRALGAVAATGFRVDPSATPIEQAKAASPRLPVAARPLGSLAELATWATYAPAEDIANLDAPLVPGEPGPQRWCRQVEQIAADSMTTGGRLRRYFTVWR